MAGIHTFHDINDALRLGYQVEDRNSEGYLVRIMTPSGWQRALVVCKPQR